MPVTHFLGLTNDPVQRIAIAQAVDQYLFIVLCDDNGEFLRHFIFEEGAPQMRNTLLDGDTTYVPTGNVYVCNTGSSGGGGGGTVTFEGELAQGFNHIGSVNIDNAVSITTATPLETNASIAELPDVRDSWRIGSSTVSVTNDSDTTVTVPANTEWQILSVFVTYSPTITTGERNIGLELLHSDNTRIGLVKTDITQPGNTVYTYQFAPGLTTDIISTGVQPHVTVSTMSIFLSAGQKIRIYDQAAIDPVADDMIVKIQYASRSIL